MGMFFIGTFSGLVVAPVESGGERKGVLKERYYRHNCGLRLDLTFDSAQFSQNISNTSYTV